MAGAGTDAGPEMLATNELARGDSSGSMPEMMLSRRVVMVPLSSSSCSRPPTSKNETLRGVVVELLRDV
jgi:hypothetical protein